MIPASVVVLTKNEESVIARTIRGLTSFDQIIVVDSFSSDKTAQIARELGAEVVEFSWNGRYPKKKQWALEQEALSNDWVLFVDADEILSEALVQEIEYRLRSSDIDEIAAFDVRVDYHFMGQRLRHGHQITKRILVNRRRARFEPVDDLAVETMWEVEGHYQPSTDGRVDKLGGFLLHDDIDPLFSFIARHNRYSDWEAHLRLNPAVGRHVARMRRSRRAWLDRVPAAPLAFFLYAFVFKKGFLDGRAGLDYALAYSFYLWQIDAKVREKKWQRPDTEQRGR